MKVWDIGWNSNFESYSTRQESFNLILDYGNPWKVFGQKRVIGSKTNVFDLSLVKDSMSEYDA